MEAQYTFTTFTPGEAEAITGLSTSMQRDWRRHEYLPRTDGHARFDAFALAQMLAMKTLADRGVGPQVSKDMADWCALGICWQALGWKDAFEGDHLRTFEWDPSEAPTPQAPDPAMAALYTRVVEAMAADGKSIPSFEETDQSWGGKADWLRRQIVRLRGFPRILPQKYLIWWANGDHLFADSLDDAFGMRASADAEVAGAVIILDFFAIASLLLDRTGRPLVHVEFPADAATGQIQQPLRYGAPVRLTDGQPE